MSYARRDGEAFATALRLRLEREHPELPVWQDRSQLQGGASWWAQIEAALEHVAYVVAVITPAALSSEFTAKEWRRAREEGVCVVPVLAVAADELDWSLLPPWQRKLHFLDLDKEWPTFIAQLRSPCVTPRTPFMAPDLPWSNVERARELDALVGALLRTPQATGDRGGPAFTALHGAGGFGKTALATAACHDRRVLEALDDGILWITLGQTPNLERELGKVFAAVTGERPAFIDLDDAVLSLSHKLATRDCLFVVDDVWRPSHVRPILRAAGRSRVLVTTRQADVSLDGQAITVDEMAAEEAVKMLAAGLADPEAHRTALTQLARRLGEWPLLLRLCSSALRLRLQRGDSLAGALSHVDRALTRRGPRAFDAEAAMDRDEAVAKTFELSLNLLDPQDRRRCAELSVFPEDVAMPLEVVAGYLGLDAFDTEEFASRLGNSSLVQHHPVLQTMAMHDMTRSFLAGLIDDVAALHSRLLRSLGDPMDLGSAYGRRWMSYHLHLAGRQAELESLLLDLTWLVAKLEATDVGALIDDCEHASAAPAIQALQSALRLSAPVLTRAKDQLRTQLLARLADLGIAEVERLRTTLAGASGPAMLPLASTMLRAQGSLECVIESDFSIAPARWVRTRMALSRDGRWVVGVLPPGPVNVWDIRRRRAGVLGVSAVGAVAMRGSPGSLLVGLSDGRLQQHDLHDLALIRDWGVHPGGLAAVVSDSEQRVLASLSAGEIRLWDLASGRLLHAWAVSIEIPLIDCAVTAGGQTVVVCTPRELLVLDRDRANPCRRVDFVELGLDPHGLSSDGRLLLTRLNADQLRVWRVETLTPLRSVPGFYGSFTADGRAVVVAKDHEVEVCDLQTGSTLALRGGHRSRIEAVACGLSDGQIATAESGRLLVWAPGRATSDGDRLQAHAGSVNAIVVSANGQWVGVKSRLIIRPTVK